MWLSDFRIVLADRDIPQAALRIEDGLIAEISETPVARADIQGHGLILMPGMIDMHGDMIEREIEPRPGVRMPMELGLRDLDRHLATAGVTTAYAAVSFSPGSTYGHMRSYDFTCEMIRSLREHRKVLLIDHRVHARFEVTFPAVKMVGILLTMMLITAEDSQTVHTWTRPRTCRISSCCTSEPTGWMEVLAL